MAGRLCPRCLRPMIVARRGEVQLDICISCGGSWFDQGELAAICAGGPGNVYRLCEKIRAAMTGSAPPAKGPDLCPVCSLALVKTEHGGMAGIFMEACHRGHGLWVGLYALGQIGGRLAEEALAPPAPAAPPVPQPSPPPISSGGSTAPVPQRGATAPLPGPGETGEGQRLCRACNQPNSDRAAVCWACGALLQHIAVDVCPQCQGSFRAVRWEGVDLRACDGCGGFWLERDRLGALLFQPAEVQDRLLEEIARIRTGRIRQHNPALICPHCQLLLFASPMGRADGHPVHTCPQCRANFLTHGLLDELIAERR